MLNSYIVFEHLTNDETTCVPPSQRDIATAHTNENNLCVVRNVLYVTD